jgi:predicted negative regulator of RcsB-dependent stress response
MAVIIVLAWLLAMLGLFGWLLWWDRSDGRDQQEPPRTLAVILDEAVARALDGDETCERFLWETLAGYLSDYRDMRSILEYAREQPAHKPPLDVALALTRDATREGTDRELEIVAMQLARPRTPD